MYRSDGFLVPGVGVGRYHRLAEAIRRGCELRPKKVKGYWRRGDYGACALGAAVVGVGKEVPRRYVYAEIARVFPEIREQVRHPILRACLDVGSVINSLNEHTDSSREEVAGWLCRVGGCQHRVVEDEIKPWRPVKNCLGFERRVDRWAASASKRKQMCRDIEVRCDGPWIELESKGDAGLAAFC
jgi:hypothetical protein